MRVCDSLELSPGRVRSTTFRINPQTRRAQLQTPDRCALTGDTQTAQSQSLSSPSHESVPSRECRARRAQARTISTRRREP